MLSIFIKIISDNIIIISILISLVTMIILIINLIEYIKQNRKLYEPKLFPITNNFDLFMKHSDKYLPKINKENNDIGIEDFFIQITNIGQGLAKNINIHIKYDIDIKNLINSIKSKFENTKTSLELFLDNNDMVNYKYYIDKDNLFNSRFKLEDEVKKSFDYSLSVNVSGKEHIYVKIPEIISMITKLNCLYMFLQVDNGIDFENEVNEINQINCKLKIEYFDITNKKYKDEYILKTNFISLHRKMSVHHCKLNISREMKKK